MSEASAAAAAQLQQTTSSNPETVSTGHHGGPEKMNRLLDANYLGVHKLAVSQLKPTEFTRQLNARGLKKVRASIIEKGWVSSSTPYVLVPREQLPEGKQTDFSPCLLKTLTVYTLDGNHRIRCLLDLEGPNFMVECRLYLHFDCARTINALARSVNTVTGAVAETTTYDRIFSTIKAMQAIMAIKGFQDATKVTAAMLAEAYILGGDVPPSNPQLCGNKRLAIGFSDEAFAALKTVSESEDPSIDVPSLSKNLLDSHIVTTDLKPHPLEQSFLVHILARFKKHNKKAPLKENLPSLKRRAMEAGELHRRIESVIPRDSWTPEFEKSFYDLMHGRQTDWDTWGSGHTNSREEEATSLQELLPTGRALSAVHLDIIKIAKQSSDLRPYLDAWDQRMASVNSFIELNKNLPSDESSDSSSSSSSSDEEKDEEGDDPDLCAHCNPEKATGFCCPKCSIHHMSWCSVTAQPEEEEEGATKERPCVKCLTEHPPAKKRKKNVATLVRDDNAEVETSMSRNTAVHTGLFFSGRTRAYIGGTPLKVNTAPKLAIVDFTRETHLFKTTDSSRRNLKVVLESVVDALHPQGTMAFALPRPWLTSSILVGGAFTEIEDKVVIEEHPLLVQYDAVAGGALKKAHENHLRNQTEQILIVHRICPPDKPFTCNRRVVVSDVFGHSMGQYPHAKQVFALESLPAGAPNGGSRCLFPAKVAHFLIGRFTNATDTILGIGVEATDVAQEAIEKGRCVEFYVMDDAKRGMLTTKIHNVFRTAYSRGLFQSRRGEQTWVGPTVLPSGLPRSTVPSRVTELLETSRAQVKGGDNLAPYFKVAQTIAKDYNYELKGEQDRTGAELRAKKKREAHISSDILVWGQLVIYTSPSEAKATLEDDEVDEQFVRLIEVANNAQLRLMLEAGVELCGGDAALYLRVDPTCPIYWVRWDARGSKADLDIVCDIPYRGSRTAVLQRVDFTADGKGGVKIRHARNKSSDATTTNNSPLLVNTGCGRIVGAPNFPRRSYVV